MGIDHIHHNGYWSALVRSFLLPLEPAEHSGHLEKDKRLASQHDDDRDGLA
jgi:hypothetical protein